MGWGSGSALALVAPRFGITVHAQQEIRIDQHPLERELNARLEGSSVATAISEERHQRLHVPGIHRTPIRQPRDPRQDLRRARFLVCNARGTADKQTESLPSAFCPLPFTASVRVRAADLNRRNRGVAHVDFVVRNDAAALERLRQTFGLPERAHE